MFPVILANNLPTILIFFYFIHKSGKIDIYSHLIIKIKNCLQIKKKLNTKESQTNIQHKKTYKKYTKKHKELIYINNIHTNIHKNIHKNT